MLKLMKLEMRKTKINGYIRAALIANLILIAQMLFIIYTSGHEGEAKPDTISNTFYMVSTLVKAIFIIFSGVMIANIIINEYRNNTISVLFMYPVSRKKLMAAKLLIIAAFTFTAVILSNVFTDFILLIVNNFYHFTADKLTANILINYFISIAGSAAARAGIGLMPLLVGMWKKSISLTIVSSVIIITLICNNKNAVLAVWIDIILAAAGIIIAYLSIRNIEHVDVSR